MTDGHRNLYRVLAVAILVAGVVAEAARLVMPWIGFRSEASRGVSCFLMALWSVAALVVIGRGRLRSLANAAWAIAWTAALAMFVHGAVTRVGGSVIGLLYLPAAIALGFLLKRSFIGSRASLFTIHDEPEHAGAAAGLRS